MLLSAARLPPLWETRGFAPPPRSGLAFVVGTRFIPRYVHNTQHVVQKATRVGKSSLGFDTIFLPPCSPFVLTLR
jgi:hypothetical protein